MKNSALWYRQFGKPSDVLQLETNRLCVNEFMECLVQMIASPINPSDLIPITGAYSHRVVPPLVAGYEGVGIVIKAKDATLLGKRVLALCGEGAWHNYVACPQDWIVPVPDFINDDLAVRGYINPLAAYLMLKQCDLVGKTVLVTAAGSSCANILAQWARIFGAKHIIGIYRSPKHITTLESLGVTPVSIFDHKTIVCDALKADFVFDAVGGDLASLLLQSINKSSQFISYGLLSGKLYQVNLGGVLPVRFHIRDHLTTMTNLEWQNNFSDLWQLLKKTQLSKILHFDLTQWQHALTFFEQSGRNAKPVFVMK